MAAIISRITRENRARKERMGKEVSIAKCTYHLDEFPERFVPAKHNKYLKNRNIFLAVERMNARVQEQFQKRIQGEMDGRQSSSIGTKMDPDMGRDCAWWRTCCCECFVIRQSSITRDQKSLYSRSHIKWICHYYLVVPQSDIRGDNI